MQIAGRKASVESPILKLKLERQLDGARAADLTERVEATVCAAGAEAARQRLRRLAEQWVCQVVVGDRAVLPEGG